jgi:peptide/nickel transport system permease protein
MAVSATALAPAGPRGRARGALHFANRHRLLVLSGTIIAVYILVGIIGPWIAPYDPNALGPGNNLQPPSPAHPLGTDKEGRDVLSRILVGARYTLIGAFGVVVIAAIGGFVYGLVTAYVGGRFDAFSMRLFDLMFAFPPLVIAIVLVATFGPGLGTVVLGVGLGYLPAIARIIRSEALVQRHQQYVSAALGLGYSGGRIVFRHLMPNCTSQIIVQVSINLPYAIIDLAGLSYLGFGIQPPTADWGRMLAEAQKTMLFAPWLVVSPAFVIIVLVLAWNIFGAQLRRALDPRRNA